MKFLKKNAREIVICLIEILVGILLLIKPVGFTAGIIIAVGVILLLDGIWSVIQYFRTSPAVAAREQTLAKGLMVALAGGFLVAKRGWLIAAVPALVVLYGVAMLLIGLYRVQLTVDLLRVHNHNWCWAALNAALSILFAVIILGNPFGSTVMLWTFTAISLIISAVVDAVTMVVVSVRHAKG